MLYYFKDRSDPEPVDEVPLKRSEVAVTTKINKPFCFELNAKAIEKVCRPFFSSLKLRLSLSRLGPCSLESHSAVCVCVGVLHPS